MNKSAKVNMKGARGGEIVLTLSAAKKDAKLDPFDVGETVCKALGYKAKAKTDEEGRTYTFKVSSEEQAKKMTRTKKLNDGTKIKVERDANLNTVRCIIQSKVITDMPDDTLTSRLKDQGVISVRSIKPERRLKIVTLTGTKVPPHIRVGLLTVKTEKYYNMPKVCRECKQLGHITEACGNAPRCGVCSGGHEERTCKRPPYCLNCGGGHPPLDKACPTYQQEKAIIKLHTDLKIPPKLARKKFMAKVKSRYIPLPAERSADSESDSESEGEPVEDPEQTDTQKTPEKVTGSRIPNTPSDHGSPTGPRTVKRKQKPETKPGKPSKRRSTRLASTTENDRSDAKDTKSVDEDDNDDFLLDAERELLRRRLEEDEVID